MNNKSKIAEIQPQQHLPISLILSTIPMVREMRPLLLLLVAPLCSARRRRGPAFLLLCVKYSIVTVGHVVRSQDLASKRERRNKTVENRESLGMIYRLHHHHYLVVCTSMPSDAQRANP